ncbi:FAD-binding monooxygenase [Nonomuraea phyllanthi]|uniref:FAD-binding monooxygenase n=1 Tax=Nonomuraea phyllanthi TaxID=2219224 RepID=A0A5C4WP74_9ACTN|nr:FAD-dependent monooxygenase [Nonomuraea phyllanthi]KAB8195463.1 FAD-binding monooxygenase [Nonomuraea phyllanthi]QFY10403.1 FAD-binding monooxygenase [Nonomuraea phyllanthi]
MKISCVGGGPAGLYFAILMKRIDPSHDITVHERDPAGSTYGWGVTFWDELLHTLYGADPPSGQAIAAGSVRWDSWVAHVQGRATVVIEQGEVGFGIGRRELLAILAERARSLGVTIAYESEIDGEEDLAGADLVVACDGVNSALRERHAEHFGTEVALGRNMYVWLGTTKIFEAFTFAFTPTPHGWIWCYGYGFGKDHSTCVIECSPDTWSGLGLHEATEADALALLEKLFAEPLDGHPLVGRPRWQTFRTLTNRTWHRGNLVLLGDAAHTTHYSVGAGTALALGDAAFLADALHGESGLEAALTRYERQRMATIRPLQKTARLSAQWYENLPRYIGLPPMEMFSLLFQRHSRLLPHVPPRLYYRLGRVADRLEPLYRATEWLGSKVTRRSDEAAAG